MKKIRILLNVLKKTNTDKLIVTFVIIFLISALLIQVVEPRVQSYGDALWYCYSVFSTAGFGDFVAETVLGRIISVVLTILTILVVALVTGVIVSFYNEVVSMQYKASRAEVIDRLEHLEDLSREELKELSERIRKISSS